MATAGESYRASSGSVVASNGDLFWSAAPITMRACFEVWIKKGGSGDEIGARSHFGGWYLGRGVDRRADGVCVGCRALQHFACQRLSEPGGDGCGGLRLPILHFRMVGHTDSATGTYVQESVTDWYDGCRAGNVGITAQCWGRCSYIRQGSFWDSSRGANTDWVNAQTYGKFWEPECVWLRFWTTPNGFSYWASGENLGWC